MTARPSSMNSERLLRLSEEVSRIAGSIAKLSNGEPAPERAELSSALEAEELAETVKWLIRARRERTRYLCETLFAEPAWDMLLDLLEAELAFRRVAVSSLCIASGVPASTGLRWINNMVSRGILVRRRDPHDARRVFIELAPDVSASLRRYFADVVRLGRGRA